MNGDELTSEKARIGSFVVVLLLRRLFPVMHDRLPSSSPPGHHRHQLTVFDPHVDRRIERHLSCL